MSPPATAPRKSLKFFNHRIQSLKILGLDIKYHEHLGLRQFVGRKDLDQILVLFIGEMRVARCREGASKSCGDVLTSREI